MEYVILISCELKIKVSLNSSIGFACKLIQMMHFEIIGKIENIETIAVSKSIHELARLREQFGEGRWRKLKGIVTVRMRNGAKS